VSEISGGDASGAGFAQAAIRGSLWTALQAVVNKLAAAGATLALGFLLHPTEFGAAWFAVSSALLVSFFHVIALGDVLLAYPAYIVRLAAPAQRLAFLIAGVQSIVILLAAVGLSSLYPDRTWLFGLMAVAACRPLSDAFAVIPLARLRRDLRFRQVSLIDGISALCASLASVSMAWMGAGPFAIVVPPIALIGARGVLYRRAVGPTPRAEQPFRGMRALLRRAALSAFGSYVAGVLFLLETMVLGLLVPERSLGLFAFAFGLASQVNSIVSFQIAGALQPIFGHIEDDPRRQIEGFLRSCRLVSAALVPALLVQAAAGGEFIRAAWGSKWNDAVTIFQVLSVGQALYVCQWPAAFVLKSQGRFFAYVKLQLLNIVIAGGAFLLAGMHGGGLTALIAGWLGRELASDAVVPVAVASAAVAVVAVFAPLSLWVAGRVADLRLRTVLDVLWRPWAVALPTALLASWVCREVATCPVGSRLGQITLIVVAAAACAAAGIVGAVLLCPTSRADSASIARALLRRLGRSAGA
jgi:O-antigen/teichoic acid export membrane protein